MSSNNSMNMHGSRPTPDVMVSVMVAPIRFRRKALAVAAAFVVASAAAACSASPSSQTAQSPPESLALFMI